jgi:hypothetical protein
MRQWASHATPEKLDEMPAKSHLGVFSIWSISVYVKPFLALLLLAGATACTPKATTAGAEESEPARTNRDRNLISQVEIEANPSLKASSALDLIRSLRPQYFSDRGVQSIQSGAAPVDPEMGMVHASINGGRIVSVNELAELHGNELLEVRYLSSGQAMQRFGSAARSGPIILVTTTKR